MQNWDEFTAIAEERTRSHFESIPDRMVLAFEKKLEAKFGREIKRSSFSFEVVDDTRREFTVLVFDTVLSGIDFESFIIWIRENCGSAGYHLSFAENYNTHSAATLFRVDGQQDELFIQRRQVLAVYEASSYDPNSGSISKKAMEPSELKKYAAEVAVSEIKNQLSKMEPEAVAGYLEPYLTDEYEVIHPLVFSAMRKSRIDLHDELGAEFWTLKIESLN